MDVIYETGMSVGESYAYKMLDCESTSFVSLFWFLCAFITTSGSNPCSTRDVDAQEICYQDDNNSRLNNICFSNIRVVYRYI